MTTSMLCTLKMGINVLDIESIVSLGLEEVQLFKTVYMKLIILQDFIK